MPTTPPSGGNVKELGPCVVCGKSGYSLSCGGPSICPPCDCGIPVREQELKAEVYKFKAALHSAEERLKEIDGVLTIEQNRLTEKCKQLSLAQEALEGISRVDPTYWPGAFAFVINIAKEALERLKK